MAASAFTSVETRTAFGVQPSAVSNNRQPQQQAPVSEKIEWPPAVKLYVQRTFAAENQISGVDGDSLTSKLKEIINTAVKSRTLNTLEWDQHPLPQQFIMNECVPSAAVKIQKSWPNAADIRLSTTPTANTNPPKKRKSTELDDNATASVPPWRSDKKPNAFESRLTYPDPEPSKRQEKRQRKFREDTGAPSDSSKTNEYLERRRQRFAKDAPRKRETTPPLDATSGPVVGTCEKLEKQYLRLTAPPRPETVRPLHILRQTFQLLREKWKSDHNYHYICDQFKSLRQDLTVQHIRNDFVVKVYESHARIALEVGDIGEYNQCQTQLRALYKQNLGGHPAEFLAYRILYFIYTRSRTDMNRVLAELTSSDRKQPAVQHALQARSALGMSNYHRFFQLYNETPNMGAYLMDLFVDRERISALACLSRAYKPDLSIQYVSQELSFKDEQACAQFICDHGGEDLFEQKESGVRFTSGKAGQLFENAKRAAYRQVDIKGQI